ncbi:MAG: hypothetical protein KKF44_03650 [Nanoarchaeota archaeon]|nr:hypothetical protein [Nanoarchaeota archaeon]
MRTDMNEKEYCNWLDEGGYSYGKVKCAKCEKEYEEILPNRIKEDSLKNDVFICEDCDF